MHVFVLYCVCYFGFKCVIITIFTITTMTTVAVLILDSEIVKFVIRMNQFHDLALLFSFAIM